MKVVFRPSKLAGEVEAPPSKSHLHRLLIASAISEGVSEISGYFPCDDGERTLDCLRKCGVNCTFAGENLFIEGRSPEKWDPNAILDCKESGSTLRLLLPLLTLSGGKKTLNGSEKLLSRPLSLYKTLFEEQKIGFSLQKNALTIDGRLGSFDFSPEDVLSSQFVSGLLFAMPHLPGSRLTIPANTESFPYITLTENVMRSFGFAVSEENRGEKIAFSASGRGSSRRSAVLKDPSGSAFFAALSLFGNDVSVRGLDADSLSQADGVFPAYFAAIENGAPTLDCANCPDLAPILMVAAAKNGAALVHTRRLSYKESDRAAGMRRELMECGATLDVKDDRITVQKSLLKRPKTPIDPAGDHRVAMAMSILLATVGGTLENASCVSKSMPDFFDKLAALGADFDVISEEKE